MPKAVITGVGHYAPPKVMTNKDLEKLVDTNDEWIQSRTGIRERRILESPHASSYMAHHAVNMLYENRSDSPDDIDLIIFATVTPDTLFPSSSCRLQEMIGAKNAWGMDLNGACSGFLYALTTGAQFIETGMHKKVLVVGADKMSAILDYEDRATCILFGDAAGVVLLEPAGEEGVGVMDSILHSDGSGVDYLYMMGGGSMNPATHETVDQKLHYIYQDGQSVFKFAVKGMADVSAKMLEKNGLSNKDVRFFIPHQANKRIIDAAAKRMGLSDDQVVINIDRYGNTTAATIPLALSEVYRAGALKKGDNIIMAAFGAGFTWGSIWVRWGI